MSSTAPTPPNPFDPITEPSAPTTNITDKLRQVKPIVQPRTAALQVAQKDEPCRSIPWETDPENKCIIRGNS